MTEQQAAAVTALAMVPTLYPDDPFAMAVWVELVTKALPDLSAQFDAATPAEQGPIRAAIVTALLDLTEGL